MLEMLERLIRECRCLNKFALVDRAVSGTITIQDGSVSLPLLPGQYFWLTGSVYSTGLRKEGVTMPNETFVGTFVPLAIPPAFLDLAARLDEWTSKNVAPSPFQSESFDGYSYTRASGSNGGQLTWQDAFRDELAIWRTI